MAEHLSTAEHNDGTVQHSERSLNLNCEIYVSGRIDDVDSVFIELTVHTAPKTSGRSGRNGDTALLLLLHPIHGGSTIVHLTYLVRNTGVKKNAFGSSGFTGINVGTNSDIAIAVNRGFASQLIPRRCG